MTSTRRGVVLAALFAIFAAAPHVTAQVRSVAIFDGAAPVVFVDENGDAAGIYPDVIKTLLTNVGYTVEFVTGLSFSEAYDAVVAGDIDFLPAAVHTEERASVLDFNEEPVFVAWGQLGHLPGADVSSVFDLRDQPIGLMRNGQNGVNFVHLMESFDIPFVPVYFDTFPEISEAIIAGDLLAGVYFNAWLRAEERIVPSSIVFSPSQGFIATAKGTNANAIRVIDRELRHVKGEANSYYYQILDRWLSPTAPMIPNWVWIAAAVAGGVVTVLLLFVVLLRREVWRATARLHESKERYRTVADHAHGWEFWKRPDGGFEYLSPSTENVSGYPAEAFREDPGLFDSIVVDEDRGIWHDHLREVEGNHAGERSSCTFRIRRRDGEVRWIEHRCTNVTADSGEYLGHRGTNIDITERVHQSQVLERALREKEVMLHEIHHRVKNNLQTVSSLIALQQRSVGRREVRTHLDTIAGRVSAMGLLHSTVYAEETFGVANMQDYIAGLVTQIKETVATSVYPTINVEVEPIELSIEQALPCGLIINEGITNAFKHAFPEQGRGTISVRLAKEAHGTITLEITDDGGGIDGNDSASDATAGVGVALIEALALQLGGSHSAGPARDARGFTVAVTFPAKDAASR